MISMRKGQILDGRGRKWGEPNVALAEGEGFATGTSEMKIAGWVLSVLIALFLAGASAAPKFMGIEAATSTMEVVGWPMKYLVLIGAIEVVCMVLFLIPRTALLGAVLTTGLLGGSLAANLRVDNPLFSHTLFSIYLGIAVWLALWLREEKVRAVFPLVR